MSQLADILSAQKTLEESFLKKMSDLEAQIQSAGPAKDTVARVAEEFRTFRELIFNMLGLLRKQISECSRQIDVIETRHRRKALVFLGVAESEKEDCKSVALGIINSKLSTKNMSSSSIKVCHRLGASSKDHHRPILVKFASEDDKSLAWNSKTKLKGSSITVREFLTKSRQSVFAKARLYFGMRACWTQDGVINIKVPDGSRLKITHIDELSSLLTKFPKVQGGSSATSRSDDVVPVDNKTRK